MLKKSLILGSVALLGVVGLSLPMNVQTAEAKVPVLSVYGEAEVTAKPDSAKIYGVMKKTSTEIEETTNIVDSFSKLKEELIEIGVEEGDVQTLYFYDTAMNFDGDVVYRACLDFYVHTEDMESLKEIVDLVNGEDNTKVKNISYELKSDEAYNQALSLAKENAIQKAESLVNTDSMEISEIEEECFYYCNNNFKDFVSSDDLVQSIVVKAKVKVTMDYVENEIETEEPTEEEIQTEEVEIDKETGEIIEE